MSQKTKQVTTTAEQILEADIEKVAQPQQAPQVQPTTQEPHDSSFTYSQIKGRHTKEVFPTLDSKEPDNKGTYVLVALVALSVFSAWGLAYGVQYALTPHVQGICDPPAVIENGGCFTTQVSQGSNGNTITTLVPAGHLAPTSRSSP
jgi:hypothetical protein